jgi:alkaline phosphatase D
MLGDDQREWFLEAVTDSDATWTVWTDEVLTIPLKVGAGPLTLFPVQGGWDGYVRERRQVMEHLDANDVENFVTLTGDAHCYIAGYQQTRYDDTLRGLLLGTAFESDRVGVEFMTPPTTSLNVAEALGVDSGLRRRLTEPLLSWLVEAMNPHVELFDSHHWGYSVVEFSRSECRYLGYSVDKTEDGADAGKELLVAKRVPEGRVEIQDVTEAARRTEGGPNG